MKPFFKKNKQTYHFLWNAWQVELDNTYKRIYDEAYGQLFNENSGRVVYGSSHIVTTDENIADATKYYDVIQDDDGYSLSASVSRGNEFLTITVSYVHAHDEEWAKRVIESVRRL